MGRPEPVRGLRGQDTTLTGGFKKKQKDPHLWTKDTVEIMIDPDGDGDNKDYYEIQVNPQNLVFDSHFDDYNKPRRSRTDRLGTRTGRPSSRAPSPEWNLDNNDKDQGYTVEMQHSVEVILERPRRLPQLGDTGA